MNLKNVNYAVHDSSCILQPTDIKLASAALPVNISVQKNHHQNATLFTEHVIIVPKNVWYSFWLITY